MSRASTPAFGLAAALLCTSMLARPALAAADGPVDLGTADSFAILAGAGITNTNATTITGDVGTFPTTTRSGFASVTLTGTDHGGDAVTQGAKDDLVTAYDDAAGRVATPHAVELGGETLLPGVYASETFGLTGTLTLDAEGRADAQFVFQTTFTLIAEVGSRVLLINGASPCQVVWQVGSSATFKTGTDFVGDVLAYTSITAQSGADFIGRLLARNGAVTLDNNTITNAACADATGPAATTSPTPGTSSTPGLTASPVVVATSGVPAAGVTTSTDRGTGTPTGTTGGTPPAAPRLPDTGQRGGLLLTGLGMLAVGVVVLSVGDTAGYPKGRRRRAV